MRNLYNNELYFIRNERDLLEGYLNRMCTTMDNSEFESLYKGYLSHLNFIYVSLKRFKNESEV